MCANDSCGVRGGATVENWWKQVESKCSLGCVFCPESLLGLSMPRCRCVGYMTVAPRRGRSGCWCCHGTFESRAFRCIRWLAAIEASGICSCLCWHVVAVPCGSLPRVLPAAPPHPPNTCSLRECYHWRCKALVRLGGRPCIIPTR